MTVAPGDLPKALHELAAATHLSEAVLLSTCNRIEVYAYAERFHGGYADIRELLAQHSGLPLRPSPTSCTPFTMLKRCNTSSALRPGSTRWWWASTRFWVRFGMPGRPHK